MALKDWEKNSKNIKKSFKETKWSNKQSSESLSVVYDGDLWRVWLYDVFGYEEELKESGFKTKSQALKLADDYMRKH